MTQYSKFIAAIVGIVALLVKQHAGIDLGDEFVSKLTDILIAALTAYGVFRVENKPGEGQGQ